MPDDNPQPSLDDLVDQYDRAHRKLQSLEHQARTYADDAANLLHEFLYAIKDRDEVKRRRDIVKQHGQLDKPRLRFIPDDKGQEVLTGIESLRKECEELQRQMESRGVAPHRRRT